MRRPPAWLPILALSACGFQLQGRVALPAALAQPHVSAPDAQSEFVQLLRQSLRASGSRLSDSSERASAVISIEHDALTERVISVSARNIPREYELTYTVRYRVVAQGRELLSEQQVELTRELSFDETRLLAKQREQEMLEEGLARDLVAIVMRRLASL
jgi:LPS-assembly lipoprotein